MTRLFLSTKAIPVAASFAVHVALASVVGGHAASSSRAVPGPTEVAIEIEPAPAPVPAPPVPEVEPARDVRAKPASTHAHSHATHTHAYPVAPDHDARAHDPSLVHAPLAAPPVAAPVAVVAAPESEPVRFTLPVTTRIGTVGGNGHEHGSEPGAAPAGNDASPLVEAAVSTKARLLSATPALYPSAARTAEVEADVPVEIVVGRDGRVEAAMAVGPASGFGLDRAAEVTVRGYRFTAATKDGAPVRVRMRWVVQFRLR